MHPYATPQLREDLREIVSRSESDLRQIGDQTLVILGASGFVGTWLTLSFLEAKKELGVRGNLILVSRNSSTQADLLRTAGYKSGFRLIDSDVRLLSADEIPQGARLINAATPARASLNSRDPLEMLDIIVQGQKNLLGLASKKQTESYLFLSSGAVYGEQPFKVRRIDESWQGAPDIRNIGSAYHEGKRVAEMMGNLFATRNNFRFVSARLFAFLAPFLPTNEHFAAGNFIGDAIAGRDICISSGGGSVRSYQYGTDMSVWLWALLSRGLNGKAYNVGSEEDVSIRDLAFRVAQLSTSEIDVDIRGADTSANVSRYVPSTAFIRNQLGVRNDVELTDSIRRTLRWARELSV